MKECGECTLCCTLTRVPELNKAEGVPCSNLCNGCSIYDIRPPSCSKFQCLWTQDENMSENLRPDKCGAVLEKIPNEDIVMVLLNGNISKELKDYTLAERDNGVSFITTKREVLAADDVTIKDIMGKLHEFAKGLE